MGRVRSLFFSRPRLLKLRQHRGYWYSGAGYKRLGRAFGITHMQALYIVRGSSRRSPGARPAAPPVRERPAPPTPRRRALDSVRAWLASRRPRAGGAL